jgi:hypothetical protein
MNLSAYLTSVARTVIPSAWGALISWAVFAGFLSPELQAQAEGFATVLVGVTIALYYALVRFLETQAWWPAWLSIALLGASTVPVYRDQAAVYGDGASRPGIG